MRGFVFLNTVYLLQYLILGLWPSTVAQVGLRTSPLTSLNHSRTSGLFNRWGDPLPSNSRYGEPSVELELAAILHDLAYGDSKSSSSSTTPVPATTTTSTTTTTTSSTPRTTVSTKPSESYHDIKLSTKGVPITTTTPKVKINPPEEKVNEHLSTSTEQVHHDYNYDYDFELNGNVYPSVESELGDFNPNLNAGQVSWIETIGIGWQIHIYTTAGFFSLIVFLSLYCLTRVYCANQLFPRGYYMTTNLMVFLAAFFRCVYFFHDPYGANNLLPKALSNILFHTGTPCIVSALAVLILAILRSARLVIIPLNLQSPIFVAIVSGCLIAGSLIIDISGGLTDGQVMIKGLKGVIQALIAGWGAAICVGYIIIFLRVEKAAERQQNEIVRLTFNRYHADTSSFPCRIPKTSLKLSARITLFSCIFGVILSVLQIYGIIHARMVIDIPPIQPWAWFAYQTFCRVLEILMWTCICVSSSLPNNLAMRDPKKRSLTDGQLLSVFSCKSCTQICNKCTCCLYKQKPTDDLYSTISQSSHIARNFTLHSDGKLMQHNMVTSGGYPSNQINTALVVSNGNKTLTRASTLRANDPAARLLWTNNGNVNKWNTCRPSSLIFTEEGLIKFSSEAPYTEPEQARQYLENYSKTDSDETQETLYENSQNFDDNNYVNRETFTPEKKRLQSEKLLNLIENPPNSNFIEGSNLYYVGKNQPSHKSYSPLHDPYKVPTSNSSNYKNANSFEDELYRCSSAESSGHIYASVHQPMGSAKPVKTNDCFTSENKIQNSPAVNRSALSPRKHSFSKHSRLDIENDEMVSLVNNYLALPDSRNNQCDVTQPNYFNKDVHPKSHNHDSEQRYLNYSQLNENNSSNLRSACPISPSQKRANYNGKIPTFEEIEYSLLAHQDLISGANYN